MMDMWLEFAVNKAIYSGREEGSEGTCGAQTSDIAPIKMLRSACCDYGHMEVGGRIITLFQSFLSSHQAS
jgi:hypothetical protein